MDGILNINKPPGRTSFSVVALAKRLSGERRVGHAGTLDPAATGVLPICLGRGTRVVEFLVDATKTYRAEIELGATTDTYDADGKITQRGDPSDISKEQLETALASFRGVIQQTPPMYSAVKYHGQPLYALARAGITIERQSRPAKIYRLEIIDWQPPLVTLEIDCGKGTYIRSLAHDLGQTLGCGAYLKSLIRSRCGIFDIAKAISLPQLEDACRYGYWHQFVHPVDSVLLHWRATVVSKDAEDVIRKGGLIELPNGSPEDTTTVDPKEYCRAYSLEGHFLGVLHFNQENGRWHATKVFV